MERYEKEIDELERWREGKGRKGKRQRDREIYSQKR
jgi:hypothetical protein